MSPSYTEGSTSLQKGNNSHNSPLQSDSHGPGRDHSTTLRTRYYFIPILQVRNRGTEKWSKGISQLEKCGMSNKGTNSNLFKMALEKQKKKKVNNKSTAM